MRRPSFLRLVLCFTFASLLAPVALARADIAVLLDVGTGTSQGVDIQKLNATSGLMLSGIPAGVNTAASEVHPSLSPDGKRMVFLRKDLVAGTTRVIVVDLASGAMADLFGLFEAIADEPLTPTFSEDGTKILTGHTFDFLREPGGSIVETSLANFPTGPFPHTTLPFGGSVPFTATTLHPSVGAGGVLAVAFRGGFNTIVVRTPAEVVNLQAGSASLLAPTLARNGGTVVVFRREANGRSKLVFRPLAGVASAKTTDFPAIVNASDTTVDRAALSPDGRYLAFLRTSLKAPEQGITRLFVLDTQTQLLLNPQGKQVVLEGSFLESDQGGMEVLRVPVLVNVALLSNSRTLTFRLAQPSPVGLIVQRISGTTKFLGKRVPKLKLVGRVPLGDFEADTPYMVEWDGTVDGKRVRPGKYLVTLRSLTDDGEVRDLGEPLEISICRH